MSLSSFFARLKYGSYIDSQRASEYEKIAEIFRVSPQHIYEIAHGKKVRSVEDSNIFEELMIRGIIVKE